MVQARKLAEDEAKPLAAEARKSGKSLEKAFARQPGLRVTLIEPFSWLTYRQRTIDDLQLHARAEPGRGHRPAWPSVDAGGFRPAAG